MKGKNLPLHVDPQWSSEQLLEAAVKKLKDFNQDMEDGEYVLLYPDSSQIKNIPGTDTPFTIGQYKEAIGKAYQRITLYICTIEDLLSKSKYWNRIFLYNLCAFKLKTKYFKCFVGFLLVTAYIFNNTGQLEIEVDHKVFCEVKKKMMKLLLGRNPICHLFLTQW